MKNIETLRIFFRVSNAAFAFADTVKAMIGQNTEPDAIQVMHKRALEEIEKDTPDMELIDSILSEMEAQAILNKRINVAADKFPVGGVIAGAEVEQEKQFPVFWYESNAAFGLCDSIESIRAFATHQINEPNSIKSIGDFLDISLIAPRWKPSKHGGIRSFGTRREHHGEQTLRMYLQEHGLLDEFLENWNK